MKIALNIFPGGFNLSHEALFELIQMKSEVIYKRTIKDNCKWDETGKTFEKLKSSLVPFKSKFFRIPYDDLFLYDHKYLYCLNCEDKYRTHPDLIKVIEKLGEKANGRISRLVIIEIPDGVEYTIEEYDGIESVHEIHRSW